MWLENHQVEQILVVRVVTSCFASPFIVKEYCSCASAQPSQICLASGGIPSAGKSLASQKRKDTLMHQVSLRAFERWRSRQLLRRTRILRRSKHSLLFLFLFLLPAREDFPFPATRVITLSSPSRNSFHLLSNSLK